MWGKVVAGHIRRANRNLFLTNVAILALILLIALANGRYLYNFVFGPFPVDTPTLLAIKDPDQPFRYFVTAKGEKSMKTGVQAIEQSTRHGQVESEKVTGDYLALALETDQGRRFLIVEAPEGASGTEFTGALVAMPDYIRGNFVAEVEKKHPQAKGTFLPYIMDATGFRGPGYWGLGIGLPLLALCLWNLKKVSERSRDPGRHPIARGLAVFGDPAQVVAALDAEMATPGPVKVGTLQLTPAWLLQASTYDLSVCPLSQVAWTYKKVTSHSVNMIPTGKTYNALIWSRQGKLIEFAGKQAAVDQVLNEIANRVPWAIVGYSKELENMWKNDRQGLLGAIEARRLQVLEALNAAQE